MNRESFHRLDDQFLGSLNEIDLWLRTLGIKKHNRFRRYRQNIEWLNNHNQTGNQPLVYADIESQGRLTEVLSTFVESIEIVETIPPLIEAKVEIPAELLRRAFSGPVDTFREDNQSNQARNAMFELSMAAMVARQGMGPTLSNLNPDLAFDFGDRSVKMECKRLISEGKLLERIEEGIWQLEKSVMPANNDVGIVAISLSRLFNPGDRVLMVPESIQPHDLLSRELRDVLGRMEGQLSRLTHPAVTAVLFYLSSPCYVPGIGYVRGTCATLFPLNLEEQPFLRQIAEKLRV
jgi:hypothetical protein